MPAALFWVALLCLGIAMPTSAQEDKIKEAMSSAPESVSANATILDWPSEEGGEMPVLREGTNGWTCLPDMGDTPGRNPMCLDEPWLEWLDALVNRRVPNITRTGFGYMLVGDSPASNTDPFATGPTEDNEWMDHAVPHLMIVFPTAEALEGLTSDHKNGGPWVMWRDTPYVHVMVPMPRHGMAGMKGHDM
jgi:hypothetical protein